MEIETSPLWQEAQTILANGATSANTNYTVVIHYGTKELTPFDVKAVTTTRDYIDNFTDLTIVCVQMGLGDYSRIVYPNRLNLELSLYKNPLVEGTETVNTNGQIQGERYTAVLLDDERSPTIGQGQEVNDLDSMNKVSIIDVHFQIYDKAIEQIRVMEVGGGFRSTTMEDMVKTLLTNVLKAPAVSAQRSMMGVDMVKADNQDLKGQVVIPHGTRAVDAPGYLQYRYGIYNAGLGMYLQNKNWFVYPLYDTSNFHTSKKTLTIISLPKRKFTDIERTFEVLGDMVTVLATGETGFRDDSGVHYLNAGNGARFTDADALMDAPVTTSNNKTVMKRDANNSEFVTGKAIGVNNASTTKQRITSNPFVAYSDQAAKNGGMMKVVWQNSDPTILQPGMPVKLLYLDGDTVVEVYGVLHVVNHIAIKYKGFANTRFRNESELYLFMNAQVSPLVA